MAKKGGKDRNRYLAKLVTENKVPCAFCQREVDEEITFGKLYAIGDVQVHYFCVLLSCCLIQKGRDDQGLFGFLYPDILAELERSKKHRCSYCGKGGATLGCSISQCRKQFHLPCGRERNAVSLFYGNYKTFCQGHAPKQNIPEIIMSKARLRMQQKKRILKAIKSGKLIVEKADDSTESLKSECVCVICYEEVDAFPTLDTFWPPCCARDAWFHRSCVQRMALSAGMHYLKCPLCNDKENFYQAVVGQGYYVPDRDAAWELEQNAFAEIYERPLTCSMERCDCPLGRDHDAETGIWDMKLCLLCGSVGAHDHCLSLSDGEQSRYVCSTCRPAAPQDLETLATAIEHLVMSEQATRRSVSSRRPLMSCRMSLRRTKQRLAYAAPGSSSHNLDVDIKTESPCQDAPSNTSSSRQQLNLKPPKRQAKMDQVEQKTVDNQFFSPVKLLEKNLREKTRKMNLAMENIVLNEETLQRLRQITRKPKPLSEKKKLVDGFLDELLSTMTSEAGKVKSPVKEWNSPKKKALANEDVQTLREARSPKSAQIKRETDDESSNSTFVLPSEFVAECNSDDSLPIFDTPKKLTTVEIQKNSSMEVSENNDVINIDLVRIDDVTDDVAPPLLGDKCFLKFSPNKEILGTKIDIDLESFKSQYLNEVDRDFKSTESSEQTPPAKKEEKSRKRKLRCKKLKSKRRKLSELVVKYEKSQETKKKRSRKENEETSVSISNEDMQLKISLKKKKFKLRIMQHKKKAPKPLKQYVLKCSGGTLNDFIEKPDGDVSQIKRKAVKQQKSPDNLKQTSLHCFFKAKMPDDGH